MKMLLDVIEQEANSEIGDTMLALVLSYNLQFKRKSSANITIQAVSEVHTTKNFTEKVLLLINREGIQLFRFFKITLFPYCIKSKICFILTSSRKQGTY